MSTRPLKLEDPHNLLWPYVPSYRAWFEAGGYRDQQIRRYIAAVLHFGTWARSQKLDLARLGETEVSRFLHVHLRHCRCPRPITPDLNNNRSALGHLIRHLRGLGVVRDAPPKPLASEMAAFDRRMNDVWGMTPQTRAHRRMVARRLLEAVSCCDPVDITKLTPQSIRAFVLGDGHRAPASAAAIAGAVRCYLRHRTLLGDDVGYLLRAVPKPAARKTGALPQVLTADELDTLLRAFEDQCPSQRRGYAIVRCLVDLGLRTSEVIRLRLDDIDWETGVVRLAAGKNRRGATLPLPKATGEALVSYLLHERPQTAHREIFVRHISPKGGPVGRRVVQRTLHAAYKRLGWDRTRVHIIRHTLGSRLINSGSSIKQIADVLRHRSIDTAARYVRVDQSRLSAVAFPWPGDAA